MISTYVNTRDYTRCAKIINLEMSYSWTREALKLSKTPVRFKVVAVKDEAILDLFLV